MRSRSNSTPAANSTANPSNPRIAVTNQLQQVSGSRIMDMPLQRRSMVVAIKLIAPISDAPEKMAMLNTQRVCPNPSPGPARGPTALSGG